MRSFPILSFVFGILLCHGQAPGYMGKRLTLFFDANPTPAFVVQNTNNVVDAKTEIIDARATKVNRLAFNFRPQVTAEYLLSRDIGLGLSYSRIMVGTTHAYEQTNTSGSLSYDPDVLKGQAAGVHFKFYQFRKSESVAPIGFYHTLSAYITRSNVYDARSGTKKFFKDDFIYPAATYSWGRQSMIWKGFLLKIGVEMGWAFTPTNYFKESVSDWSAQQYSGYSVHRSLAGYYFFNVNFGFGLVTF